MIRHILAALLLLIPSAVAAQSVTTLPAHLQSTNVSSTVAVTNTFQSVFAQASASSPRNACSIQNNGTHTMYVFAGPLAGATMAKSVQITAGQLYYCHTQNGSVLWDQISITGTAADAFYAASQ